MSDSTPTLGPLGALGPQPRLSDKVADGILATIVSRRLKPGDALPSERELGEQFGVSRTVIREAVRELSARGMVEVRGGSRIRIAGADPKTVREAIRHFVRSSPLDPASLTELADELTVAAASLAAAHAGADDLAELAATAARVEELVDEEERVKAELTFDRALMRAAHSQLLAVLNDSLLDSLADLRSGGLAAAPDDRMLPERSLAPIVEAITRRDAQAADQAMRQHRTMRRHRADAGASHHRLAPRSSNG